MAERMPTDRLPRILNQLDAPDAAHLTVSPEDARWLVAEVLRLRSMRGRAREAIEGMRPFVEQSHHSQNVADSYWQDLTAARRSLRGYDERERAAEAGGS